MPNARNVESVAELEAKFKQNLVILLSDYRGLTVSNLAQLRRELREIGVDFRVAKNTLLLLAANRAGVVGMDGLLTGPTAVAFATENETAAARALADFARTSRILTVKGGVLGRQVITAEQAALLATLPPKPQLQADLVGAVQGPMANMVNVLNGVLSSIVHALDQREKQLQPA